LGNRIRELCKAKGWSQEQLSAYAHVHRTFAAALERGEKNLSFHAIVLIARCFGITMAELMTGIEAGESPRPRRKSGVNTGMDRRRILRELAVAEQSIQTAKEIASPPGDRPASGRKKRRKS
jgi:transcriptional regulator with XRE-family HTH domain